MEEILRLAAVLGRVEETEELSILCGAAAEELKGLLREGVATEECGGAFELAAAWMALAGLYTVEEDGMESFTAGEVSIRKRDGGVRGQALRMQAMQVMKPWLRDEGFVFQGVRG